MRGLFLQSEARLTIVVRSVRGREGACEYPLHAQLRPPSLAGSDRRAALLAIHGPAPRTRREQGVSAHIHTGRDLCDAQAGIGAEGVDMIAGSELKRKLFEYAG